MSERDIPFQKKTPYGKTTRGLLKNASEKHIYDISQLIALKEYKRVLNLYHDEQTNLQKIQNTLQKLSKSNSLFKSFRIKKARELAKKSVSLVDYYDHELLAMEQTRPIILILMREKDALKFREKQEQEKMYKAYREKVAAETRAIVEKNREQRKKAVEAWKKKQEKNN